MARATAQKIGCRKWRMSQRKAAVTTTSSKPKKIRWATLLFMSRCLALLLPPGESFRQCFFETGVCRLVPVCTSERRGQIALACGEAAFVMIVTVARPVADLFHESRRRIA